MSPRKYQGETKFIEANLLLSFQSDDRAQAEYWAIQLTVEEADRLELLFARLLSFMHIRRVQREHYWRGGGIVQSGNLTLKGEK